ncbi:MAG: hypothetical protein GF365_00815 [Candidatus Buchananbacteria bacterium]|nr:hypothetical protein [Candidatus Buchananbacteria bacterium]
MPPKKIKQEEVDRALLILTDTIRKLNDYLNTYADDSASDLFNKMSEARKQVDIIANEARLLFQDCLKRYVESEDVPEPTVKWDKDEYGNLLKINGYKNRPPCEICRESRKVEYCHIIPRQIGGSNRETNIIYLCSTHHSCFDKGVLSKQEWGSIDWKGRSELVKSFVNEVLLSRQQAYWDGDKVVADIVYHSYKPLTEWVKKHLGCNSTDEWNKKRKSVKMIRSGNAYLG